VVALQFCDGLDALEGCLSIFAVSYPSQDSVTAANERNGLYDQQATGTTAPTWSDLLDGKKSCSLKLPTDWFQLRQVFGAYHRLLQILLGEDHNLPLEILNLFKVMDHLNEWIKRAQQCAELMTSIDIYTWSWVEQQQASAMPVSPEYGLLAQKLRLHEWSPPPLSAKIVAIVKPTENCRGTTTATSPAAPKSAAPTAPAVVNPTRESGVYDGNISVARLLQVKTPDKLPSGRIHVKHNAADTAALVAYMATHSAAAKAAPDRA
jgi:hypothetical protein